MEIYRRGILLPLTLLLLVTILGGGRHLASAPAALAQSANEDAMFLPGSGPAELATGSPSHGGLADADPAADFDLDDFGLNGYCVQPISSILQPAGGAAQHYGFRIDPASVAAGALILSSDGFTNDTGQSNDDYYCVIVRAPDVAGSMTITWEYIIAGQLRAITLTIPVFQLDFIGWHGVVGGSAAVCTVGWNEDIMRGRQQMLEWTGSGDPPNDFVVAADWQFTPGVPETDVYVVGEPYQRDGEWCIAFASDFETRGIGVTLHLVIIYDRFTRVDNADTLITRPEFIDILSVNYSEFRHINIADLIEFDQIDRGNAIGYDHRACIIPSNEDDILGLQDVYFQAAPGDGPPTTAGLTIFHASADEDDRASGTYIPGVRPGTKCIKWTSQAAGEQAIFANLDKVEGPSGPEEFPGPRLVLWDSNGDSNPDADGNVTGNPNSALVKHWNRVSHTVITRGTVPLQDVVTDSTIEAPVQLNSADGTYILNQGAVRITEWVYGEHIDPRGQRVTSLMDGAVIVARVEGQCGYFVGEENNERLTSPFGPPTPINGLSFDGRFDRVSRPLGTAPPFDQVATILDPDTGLPVERIGDGPDDIFLSITNDPDCHPNRLIRVRLDVYYQGIFNKLQPTFAHTEYLDIKLTYVVPQKQPQLAWAGEIITIEYAFATGPSGCGDAASFVHFVRSEGQPGNFIPDGGILVTDNGHAMTILGTDCSATVRYESEQPGEVDIEVFIADNPFTKIAYPVFYMAIEDVSLSVSEELVVSDIGDVSAVMRGWFVGSNPSGREAVTMPDGRFLPANRWVLPDDWEIMAGDQEFRTGWGSPAMPPTYITFFMVNEEVVNNYHTGVKHGASGWFVFDGTESSININPYTQIPAALGSESRPRIITDLTDTGGVGTVDFFGDFNLSYEECPVNVPTGNPHCEPGDIVGRTRFYAIADYPQFRGHLPAVRTETLQTNLVWEGYKRVTVQDGDTPTTKHVVVHLRDRDGFCDALGYNNVLGIPVEFFIETKDGIFLRVAGPPTRLTDDRKGAFVWSFDAIDNQGNPVNVDLVRPTAEGPIDECQVWVEISNSLNNPVDVRIFLPDTPGTIPGELRITGMTCEPNETFTVTNLSDRPMTLEGWALQGEPVAPQFLTYHTDREHLQLSGVLQPGESKTFLGGPLAPQKGWINASDFIMDGDTQRQFVELIWNQYVVSRAYCPVSPDHFIADYRKIAFEHFPIEGLPTSGEGPLILDVIVPFGAVVSQQLVAGWNLIGGTSTNLSMRDALAGAEDVVTSVYTWDNQNNEWKRYIPGAPDFVQTLTQFTPGLAYWVFAREPFTLSLPQ